MDRLPLTAWLGQLEANIQTRRLFPEGARIVVAVSGGLDSMVLLRALHELAPAHQWKLKMAHFNHQLRGAAADADEHLVRETAKKLKLPVVVGRGDVAIEAATSGVSVEMAARRLRHRFLAKAAQQGRARFVALAHHADDQVELFFVRLFRGAGGQGLAGMKWSNPSPENPAITLARPLLDQSKKILAAIAQAADIAFSEDATNASLDIVRNRVRNELLPLLVRHYQRGLAETVLRAMDLTGAEAAVVSDLAGAWIAEKPRKSFASLAVAVQRRVLQLQFHQAGMTADFDLVERLRGRANKPFAINERQTVSRGGDGILQWQKVEALAFDPSQLLIDLAAKQGRIDFAGKTIAWKFTTRRGDKGEYFDAARVGATVILRHWRSGDRFHPIGAGSPCKLQDLFTNLKIPRAIRRHRIVAATTKDEIFWVEGLRISEPFKVVPTSRRVLEWSLRGEDRTSFTAC